MKIIKYPAFLIACMLVMAACTEGNKILLFNGENLNNWDKVLFDSIANPDEVFQVRDGVMLVSGAPFGYIVTKDSYSNYKLHLEWRWPEEPANSGVFIHAQAVNPTGWPVCIEAQLAHTKAGDLIFVGQGTGMRVGDSTYITLPGMSRSSRVGRSGESSENPTWEWNIYEITCEGNNIDVIVNGVLQNQGTEATLTSGRIALQSEGGPVEFRNLYLIPLDK